MHLQSCSSSRRLCRTSHGRQHIFRSTRSFASRSEGVTRPWRVHTESVGRTEAWLSTLQSLHVQMPLVRPKRLLRQLDADGLTKALLAWSVLPALLLAAQPLAAGAQAVPVAAHSLIWQGPLCDMFSYTVLLSVFIPCEPAAAVASAVSAAGAALALVYPPAHVPPCAAATAVLLAAAMGVTLWVASPLHRLLHKLANSKHATREQLHDCHHHQQQQQQQQQQQHLQQPLHSAQQAASSTLSISELPADAMALSQQRPRQQCGAKDATAAQQELLLTVQQWLGVLGGGLLLQFWWSAAAGHSLYPHTPSAWCAAVAVGAAAVVGANHWLRHAGALSGKLQQLQEDWPAWSATLLLILQALQQMVQLAVQPNQEASVNQLLLLVLANGLMVPRALHTKQFMWFTGTCSSTLLALGQLAVLITNALSRQFQQASLSPFNGLSPCVQWVLTAPNCTSEAVVLPGLGMGVLSVWLLLSAAVLQWGWRCIQTGQP